MANSYVEIPVSGASTYTFPFPYIAEADVKVYVGGVLQTISTHYTFTSSNIIEFTAGNVPADTSQVVRIQRETEAENKLVTYSNTGLDADDLNLGSNQNFYLAQEATDKAEEAVSSGADGTLTVGGRLTNVSDPVDSQDAATKSWVASQVAGGNGSVTSSSTAPTGASQGDLWIDTDQNIMYVWTGSEWVNGGVQDVERHDILGSSLTPIFGRGIIDPVDHNGGVSQVTAVYLNGVLLKPTTIMLDFSTGDYDILDTAHVALASIPAADDEITVIKSASMSASLIADINTVKNSIPALSNIESNVSTLQSDVSTLQNAAVVTPQDFGAVADGVTDDSQAIQDALDYVNSQGGGRVFLPSGMYRKADTSGSLYVYSNTTIEGEGDSSVIFHDDTVVNGRRDMMTVITGSSNITYRNFKILGTAKTHLSETNQSQTLNGSQITNLRLEGLTIEGVRFMATSFGECENVYVTGCSLIDVLRDGFRFTASKNVRIIGNYGKNVADDVVALHNSDQNGTDPKDHIAHVVSGNTFEQCQGMKMLGAKVLTVTDNIMMRSIRQCVEVVMGASVEGNTPSFDINISNNQFLDTIGNLGTNTVITIENDSSRSDTSGSQAGVNSGIFDSSYLSGIDGASVTNQGLVGVRINNNTIARTLPDTAAWSDYGYGQLFDRVTNGIYSDPAVTVDTFKCHSINILGSIKGLEISGNTFRGNDLYGIRLIPNGSSDILDVDNCMISNNIVQDCPTFFLVMNGTGAGIGAKNVMFINNIIDLDPYFRHPSHNADNSWVANSSLTPLYNASSLGLMVGGNTFKNVSETGISDDDVTVISPNLVYSSADWHTNSLSNKGVRSLPQARNNLIIPIDADPTSATFGNIESMPRTCSSSLPTTGKYVKGHVIENFGAYTLQGSAGSQYVVSGWLRLTNGTSHVLNTDWAEMRVTTGT